MGAFEVIFPFPPPPLLSKLCHFSIYTLQSCGFGRPTKEEEADKGRSQQAPTEYEDALLQFKVYFCTLPLFPHY